MKLRLSYPTKPWIITQKFGEKKVCVKIESPGVPLGARKLREKTGSMCPIGYEDLYEKLGMNGHNGTDASAPRWWPVYAPLDGQVIELVAELERGLGIGILSHEKLDFGDPYGTHYAKVRLWHFQKLNVTKDQWVKRGSLVGWCGDSGIATSPHVHDELKPVDFKPNAEMYNTVQDNGFYGAIDPESYRDNETPPPSIVGSFFGFLKQKTTWT